MRTTLVLLALALPLLVLAACTGEKDVVPEPDGPPLGMTLADDGQLPHAVVQGARRGRLRAGVGRRRTTNGRNPLLDDEIDVTLDDPKTFTKPVTVRVNQRIMVDQEMIEFICNENEQSSRHLVAPK